MTRCTCEQAVRDATAPSIASSRVATAGFVAAQVPPGVDLMKVWPGADGGLDG